MSKMKPKSVHIMEGTYQPSRHENQWEPVADLLVKPDWLPEEAVEYFEFFRKTIKGLGCESSTFSAAVATLADAVYQRERLRKIIEADGGPIIEQLFIDTHGRVLEDQKKRIMHPAYKSFVEQDKRVFAMLCEFGLTPSSVSHLRHMELQTANGMSVKGSKAAAALDPFSELMM